MVFSKSFPRTVKGTNYPVWEEILLSDAEEQEEEQKSRQENIKLIEECIEDARSIMQRKNMKPFQTNMITIAMSLFDKRASHAVYYKESRAKEKFDKKFG